MTESNPNEVYGEPNFDALKVIQMASLWVPRILYAAAKLGIADVIAERARRADEVAAALNTNPDVTYRLLRALTDLKIFS